MKITTIIAFMLIASACNPYYDNDSDTKKVEPVTSIPYGKVTSENFYGTFTGGRITMRLDPDGTIKIAHLGSIWHGVLWSEPSPTVDLYKGMAMRRVTTSSSYATEIGHISIWHSSEFDAWIGNFNEQAIALHRSSYFIGCFAE